MNSGRNSLVQPQRLMHSCISTTLIPICFLLASQKWMGSAKAKSVKLAVRLGKYLLPCGLCLYTAVPLVFCLIWKEKENNSFFLPHPDTLATIILVFGFFVEISFLMGLFILWALFSFKEDCPPSCLHPSSAFVSRTRI